MSHFRWVRRVGLVIATVTSGVLLSCRESTSPSTSAGIAIVRGGGQTDTALAKLSQALVIEVHDTTGALASGAIVRFQSVPSDSIAYIPSLLLASLTSPAYGTFVPESVSRKGTASVLIQLGPLTARGRVAISVPDFGFTDTVSYTILPGAPARVVVTPPDTVLYVGGTAALHAKVADANGNARHDTVTFASLDGLTTVSTAGIATGAAIGRAAILAQVGTAKDTVRISVVPQGTIAFVAAMFGYPPGTINLMHLDGSGGTGIAGSAGDNQYLQWSPSGTSLVFFRPSSGGHVLSIGLSGTTKQVVDSGGFGEDNWERYAAGGSYIYFRAIRGSSVGIWRIHPDGTGLDSVPVNGLTTPAASPDGQRVIYVSSSYYFHVYDYQTGSDTALGVAGWAPHWSPDGQWIVYSTGGDYSPLAIMKPDGTQGRTLGSEGYLMAFDWSPDSKWLVAEGSIYGLELLEVDTGLQLPLGIVGVGSPSWKP